MTRRILVTGSREWTDVALIRSTLHAWWATAGCPPDIEMVEGGCPFGGADEICADEWRALGLPVRTEPMLPRDCDVQCYHKPRPPGECPRRGPERNQRMVDLGGYVHAFAFPLPNSRGTFDCIRRIEAAEIPLTTVHAEPTPEGSLNAA